MTMQNMFNLAESGQLHLERRFTEKCMPGYCTAAAIDCIFTEIDLPLEAYYANDDASLSVEEFNAALGRMAFGLTDAEGFQGRDYVFNDIGEFRDYLAENRIQATILLVTEEENHAIGLKPAGETPDQWQLVGLDQIHPTTYSPEHGVRVHYEYEPPVINTEQVWDFLQKKNPDRAQQIAHVYPAEPQAA